METDAEYPFYYLGEGDDSNFTFLMNASFSQDRPIKYHEAISVAMSCLAIIFNIIAVVSIAHVKGRLSTNLRLITSLASSDMLVGMAYMAKVTNTTLNPFFHSTSHFTICWAHVTDALVISGHLIVLLNLLGLAVDHFCAIVKPLAYPVLMSHKRVNSMIIAFWAIAVFVGFSRFIMPASIYYHCEAYRSEFQGYCELVECSRYDPEYTMYCIVVLTFFTMAFLYMRIFLQIRTYQTMQGRHSRYVRRNTRGLLTTFLIVITFAILWIPYCLFKFYITVSLIHDSANAMAYFGLKMKAEHYLYDLVLLNSMCDAVIYAVRMREVRNGFRRLVMRFTKDGRKKLNRKITLERQTSNTSGGVLMSLKNDSTGGADANQNHAESQPHAIPMEEVRLTS